MLYSDNFPFVLVNNAAFGWFGPTELHQTENIKSMYTTNVYGPINLIRKLIPVWKKRGTGHALTVTSIGGLIGFPFSSVYVSTKFAMEGFMETVQLELLNYPNIKYVLKPFYFTLFSLVNTRFFCIRTFRSAKVRKLSLLFHDNDFNSKNSWVRMFCACT